MPRCPTCQSGRVVVVISQQPRAFCASCGTRWVQEGSYQREIRPASRVSALSVPVDSVPSSEAI